MIKKDLKPEHHLVFDCDGTLIDGDVSTLTGWLLMKAGMVDQELLPEAYRHPNFYTQMNLMDYDKVRCAVEDTHGPHHALEWEIKLQSGLPHAMVMDYAHQALEHGFQNKWLTASSTVLQLLQDQAHQSWIVSGSSFPTVAALGKRYGIPEERILATKLELVDGLYQRNFSELGFVWQEGKVTALKESGVHAPYFVAGDSVGDWQMMELSQSWVWCVLWKTPRYGATTFRRLLEEKLPFGQEIPKNNLEPTSQGENAFYVASWQRKHWVFEVVS